MSFELQCLLSSIFNEFTCMLNTQKFDITTLSGTWLKDNPHLLDYMKTDGYKVKSRNREQRWQIWFIYQITHQMQT